MTTIVPEVTAGETIEESWGDAVAAAIAELQASAMPVGTILAYGAASAPAGFLLCNGAAVSRTTYAALFAVIGTTYGAGNGTTTFGLPDLRGRFPLGRAASGTGSALGASGGALEANTGHPVNIGTVSGHPSWNAVGGSHGHGQTPAPFLAVQYVIKT